MKLPFFGSKDSAGADDMQDASSLRLARMGRLSKTQRLGCMLAAFALTLFAGYWFHLSDQLVDLDTSRTQEETLKASFIEKKTQAVNLPAYKDQLKQIDQTFGSLLRELPNKSEMDALLKGINQAGLGHGLQFELFRPAPAETMSEFYAEEPVSIKVDGTFQDIGAFAQDVSRLPRIVNLDNLSISVVTPPSRGQASRLSLEATARTYRYLDQNEMHAPIKAKP